MIIQRGSHLQLGSELKRPGKPPACSRRQAAAQGRRGGSAASGVVYVSILFRVVKK